MPKRRGVDRRPRQPTTVEELEDQEEVQHIEREPKVDSFVAYCVACGTNDANAFSNRMLERRGRHGDRTRRCKDCTKVGALGEQVAEATDIFVPTSVLHSAVAEQGKATSAAPSRWEAAEAAREQIARSYAAASAAAQASHAAHAAQAAQAAQAAHGAAQAANEAPLAPPSQDGVAPGSADVERRRRKIRKALRLIAELKQRHASGAALEASQQLRINREAELRSELANLENGYVFLMEAQEAPAPGRSSASAAKQAAKRPRVDYDETHMSATFAVDSLDAGRNSQRKKLKGAAKTKATTQAKIESPVFADLLSHMQSVRSLYS